MAEDAIPEDPESPEERDEVSAHEVGEPVDYDSYQVAEPDIYLGGPGGGAVGGSAVVILFVYYAAITALMLYGLWVFWPEDPHSVVAHVDPSQGSSGAVVVTQNASRVVHVVGLAPHRLSSETLLFLTVALAGAVGGSVAGLQSLTWYVGNRALIWSWVPRLVARPLAAAVVATLVYLLLRAGLVTSEASTTAQSAFGFAGIAGFVGLFAHNVLERLRRYAVTRIGSAPMGADTISHHDWRDPGQGVYA